MHRHLNETNTPPLPRYIPRILGELVSEPTEPVTHRSAIFYGLPNSPDGCALRDFLTRNDFPFEWKSLNSTEETKCLAGVDGLEAHVSPFVY